MDPEKAAKFYGDLFGWKTQAVPQFNYYTFEIQPNFGGGFPAFDEAQGIKAGEVLVYISTDDIDASLARAEQLGGKKVLGKTEIPGIGWFAFFTDPSGNRVGLYTGLPGQAPA
jgi:predicted enzyme related to lactoylglutathione lyase